MKCPRCGSNLGRIKNKLVVVKGKEETFNPRDGVYAHLVRHETFTIHPNETTTHDETHYICPICGVKFRLKRDSK